MLVERKRKLKGSQIHKCESFKKWKYKRFHLFRLCKLLSEFSFCKTDFTLLVVTGGIFAWNGRGKSGALLKCRQNKLLCAYIPFLFMLTRKKYTIPEDSTPSES